MRLVTWNCSRGAFERKVPLLKHLDADIAIFQECARPEIQSNHCLWFGDNPRQGIAVISRAPFNLVSLETRADVPKFMIPIWVDSPQPFLLFAIWAKGDRPHPYIEGVVRGIEIYRDMIAGSPTVIMGDLNSNAIWDRKHASRENHSALVEELAQLGLVSSYHHFHDECHGSETRPTYYFQWNRVKPFHIDYCFLPIAWAAKLKRVEVGSFDEWRPHSDHRPLLTEFEQS